MLLHLSFYFFFCENMLQLFLVMVDDAPGSGKDQSQGYEEDCLKKVEIEDECVRFCYVFFCYMNVFFFFLLSIVISFLF